MRGLRGGCVTVRGGGGLAQGARPADLPRTAIKTAKTRWRDVVLVCRKCSKKLDGGGFGPDGDRSLRKALRRDLRAGRGRKAELAVIETGCFDVCPKNAVVTVNAARPDSLLIVPRGADLQEVRSRLGLVASPDPAPTLSTAAPDG